MFYWSNFPINIKENSNYENLYVKYIIQKYVGLMYYGCIGLKEIINSDEKNIDLIKEFSFKYGLLIFLREELAFLKDKTFEFYVS
jgi:hypothetical protein